MSQILSTSNDFKRLTILFIPNDGLENITSLQVLADELRHRGHRCIFAVDIASKGLMAYNELDDNLDELSESGLKSLKLMVESNAEVFKMSSIKVFEKFGLKCLRNKLEENKKRDLYYEKLIQRLLPDVMVVESTICSPALTNSGIPWVWINFGAPNLCLDDHLLPPAWSGLGIKSSETDKWVEFRDERNILLKEFKKELNDWCLSRGATELPKNSLHPQSTHLNIYVYPRDLDYELGDTFPPKTWFRFSSLMNVSKDCIEIPAELLAKPGKLIYLSMGLYGSADINLMKRLTTLLSHSDNKFIVSKGPFHSDYELPDNMWGLERLPQTQAIKAADLVLTNGDNRTITEAMFYGKPLIVLPLFGDQLDNAQRVKDNCFGIILEPYTSRLSTTFGSINSMLEDFANNRRLSNISFKMQTSEESKSICALIEGLFNQ